VSLLRQRGGIILGAALLAGCLPSSDQPAWEGRMGRFAGLIARCGCSDLSPERMVADYPRAMVGRYSATEIQAMRGYITVAITEVADNQAEICAEVCAQSCMVEAVVGPLGGHGRDGSPACPVTERDLHLTDGYHDQGGNR